MSDTPSNPARHCPACKPLPRTPEGDLVIQEFWHGSNHWIAVHYMAQEIVRLRRVVTLQNKLIGAFDVARMSYEQECVQKLDPAS